MAKMKDVCEGASILMKYRPNGAMEAQHDIIFADGNITLKMVSEEDAAALKKLGWHWSEYDCWACFT